MTNFDCRTFRCSACLCEITETRPTETWADDQQICLADRDAWLQGYDDGRCDFPDGTRRPMPDSPAYVLGYNVGWQEQLAA